MNYPVENELHITVIVILSCAFISLPRGHPHMLSWRSWLFLTCVGGATSRHSLVFSVPRGPSALTLLRAFRDYTPSPQQGDSRGNRDRGGGWPFRAPRVRGGGAGRGGARRGARPRESGRLVAPSLPAVSASGPDRRSLFAMPAAWERPVSDPGSFVTFPGGLLWHRPARSQFLVCLKENLLYENGDELTSIYNPNFRYS